jgi:hypothetical protein
MSAMSQGAFMLALTAAAVLLAVWLDLRVGGSRPRSPSRRIVHAAVAYVLLQASMAILSYVDDAGASSLGMTAAVFVFFLPTLVYAFLAGLWLLRSVAEVARAPRH